MNCISCGAIVTSDKRKCPYCGAKNPEYERKAIRMRALDRAQEEAKQQTKRTFKTIWEDRLCDIFLAASIVLLVGILGAMAMGKNVGSNLQKYKPSLSKGEFKAQMEEYYAAGEYDELYNFMLRNNLFENEDYYKYSQAANINFSMNRFRAAVYPFVEYVNGDRADTKYTLSADSVMSNAHFVSDWRYAEGEKVYLNQIEMCPENVEFYKQCTDEVRYILINYLMLSEEETDEYLFGQGFYEGDYGTIVKERTGYFEY